MSPPELPPDELLQILAALADGDLSDEQEQRLAEILREGPEARAYYLDHMALLTSLQWEYAAAAAPGEPAGPSQPPPRPRRRTRFLLLGAVGLSGLAAGLLLALLLSGPRSSEIVAPSPGRAEPTDDSVAVLLQAPGAEWEEADGPTRSGAPLPAGRLRLKSGLAHIQFYSGATVILEGPADFRLISAREAYCARGKLRAHVPPHAQGFTIGSPKLDLVDRGTEFGLRIDGGDKTEVHVFNGKVELYDAGGNRAAASRRELTTGQGLRLEGPGAGSRIDSDPAAFRTIRDLAARSAARARRRHGDWLAMSERLRRDPRLLVYYTFQNHDPWGRTLPDQAQGRHLPRDGTVVGCEWVAGRWPGKQALEFKRPGDRVRFDVPGEYASLTFMAWVRIDALDRGFSGLLLTDDFTEGRPHWQITQDGQLHLALKVTMTPTEIDALRSPPVFGPASLGQWAHLTSVYDGPGGSIAHYVNGELVASSVIPRRSMRLKIGPADLGNWGVPSRGNTVPIRNLNGRMDELLLFNQALEAKEIARLYQAGKPAS